MASCVNFTYTLLVKQKIVLQLSLIVWDAGYYGQRSGCYGYYDRTGNHMGYYAWSPKRPAYVFLGGKSSGGGYTTQGYSTYGSYSVGSGMKPAYYHG